MTQMKSDSGHCSPPSVSKISAVEGSAAVVDVVVAAAVVVVELGASVVTMIVSEVQAPRITAMRMTPALFTATSYAPGKPLRQVEPRVGCRR